MRRILLHTSLQAFLLLSIYSIAKAQNDRFAYAITDVTKDGSSWNVLRRLDLQTGEYSTILFTGNDLRVNSFDAASKKQITPTPDAKYGNLLQAPFSTGVAAAAYDRRHDRLYFTPMFIDQLRYIDLKTMKVYYVTTMPFTKYGNMNNEEGKVVTRMAFTSDGIGYAITNDGNSMIRFTTGKKIQIERLGSLVDDPSNNGVSIHNRCSSFGGDMIADDQGNLYILSAMNHVFKVNIETRIATHLGTIQNLPPGFSVNGAVVDADNNILVSSAMDSKSYYTINPKDWTATAFVTAKNVFKSSDLANSNVLCTGYSPKDVVMTPKADFTYSKLITVYPNPVKNYKINIQFNNVPAGDYVLEVTNVLGQPVSRRLININSETQTQEIPLNQSSTKGFYFIKLADHNNKSVYKQKVIVQ